MTIYSTCSTHDMLQGALFKAAKVGHIKLMREQLIIAGADPYKLDEENYSAISYAHAANPKGIVILLKELESLESK